MAEGLGLATVANAQVWGAAENPASGATANTWAAQAYGTAPITLGELARYGLDIGYSRGTTNATVSVQHLAPPGYRASAGHVSVGRQLADGLHVGLRVGAIYADYEEYGQEVAAVAQLGVRYRVSGGLFAGAHYTYVDEPLPPLAEHRLAVGFDYASSQRVRINFAGWQNVGRGLAGGLGINYKPNDALQLRVGARTEGVAFTFGASVSLPNGFGVSLTAIAYANLPTGASYALHYMPGDTGAP